MFVVLRIGPSQYKVSVGDVIDVGKISGIEGETVTMPDVLLVFDGKKTTIGNPLVKGATVEVKIVSQHKGEKIHIRRFKSKVRHRRHIGFRPQLTKLLITAIHA